MAQEGAGEGSNILDAHWKRGSRVIAKTAREAPEAPGRHGDGDADFGTSLISKLAFALFPCGRQERWSGMLYSYGDESGTHDGSPVMSLALAISSEFHWRKFEEEWRELVLLPNDIDVFHMQEFACRANSFYGCADDLWRRTLEHVIHILERRVQFRIAVGVDVLALSATKVAAQSESRRARVLTPYTQCVVEALAWGAIMLDDYKIPDRIAYVFESGHKHWGEAAGLLAEFEQRDTLGDRYRIQSFAPGRKSELVQLQASDALAYASGQAFIARHFPDAEHRASVEAVATLVHKPRFSNASALFELYQELGGEMRLVHRNRELERARKKRSKSQS
jgi:hypothetical protein